MIIVRMGTRMTYNDNPKNNVLTPLQMQQTLLEMRVHQLIKLLQKLALTHQTQ